VDRQADDRGPLVSRGPQVENRSVLWYLSNSSVF